MASSVISECGGGGREEVLFNRGVVQILTTSFFHGRLYFTVETYVGGG